MAEKKKPPVLVQADVIRAASERLPIKSGRALNDILEFVADDMAEAFRIGAEEAQREIVARLTNLKVASHG